MELGTPFRHLLRPVPYGHRTEGASARRGRVRDSPVSRDSQAARSRLQRILWTSEKGGDARVSKIQTSESIPFPAMGRPRRLETENQRSSTLPIGNRRD